VDLAELHGAAWQYLPVVCVAHARHGLVKYARHRANAREPHARQQRFVARALREADELLKKRLLEASEDQAKEHGTAL